MGQRPVDKPPTDPKPSAEPEDAPEQLDADVRRDVLRAAETCRERFEASPSRSAYQLGEILEALARYPHLIDPVHRLVRSDQRPSKTRPAVVTAIGGVRVRRVAMTKDPQTGEDVPVEDEDGLLVYQRIGLGRQWEGPSMVNRTRWAIGAYDADPLDVAAAVMRDLPPLLKADCRKYSEMNPERVGLAIAPLLDNNLRNALISLRKAYLDANPDDDRADEQADLENAKLVDRRQKNTPRKGPAGHLAQTRPPATR